MSTSYLQRKKRSVSPPRDLMAARKLKKRATVATAALMARKGAAAATAVSARSLPPTLSLPIADAPLLVPPPPPPSSGEPVLKAVPSPALLGPGCGPGVWPLRERLALASALLDTDNQQLTWPAISRRLGRLFSSAVGRPATWCSARACARQYALLLDSAELTKRSQAEAEHQASKAGAVAPPATLFLGDAGGSLSLAETIAKRLTAERVDELRGLIVASQQQHKFLKDKIAELESGALGDQAVERLWSAVQKQLNCLGGGKATTTATDTPTKPEAEEEVKEEKEEEDDGETEVKDFLRELTSWPDPTATPASVWTCTYGPSRTGVGTGLPSVTKSVSNSPSVTAIATPTRRTVTTTAADEDQRNVLKDLTTKRSSNCSLTNLVVEVARKRLTGATKAACTSAVEQRLNALSPTRRSILLRLVNRNRKKRPGRPSREEMAARRMLFELANHAAADVAAQAASGAASSPAADDAVPSEPKLGGRSPLRSPDADVAGSPAGSAASRSTASTTVMWESDEEADENQPAAEARESESQQPEEAKVEPEGGERLASPLKQDKETETGVSAVATDRAPTDTLPSQPQVSLSPLKPSLKVSPPNSKRTSEDGMLSPRRRSGRCLSSNSSPPSTGDKLRVSPCKETKKQHPQTPPPPPPAERDANLSPTLETGATGEHRSLRLRLSRHNGSLTVQQVATEARARSADEDIGSSNSSGAVAAGEGGQPSFSCSLTSGLRLRLSLSPLPSSGGGGGVSGSAPGLLSPGGREVAMDSTDLSEESFGTDWERWASEILDAFQLRILSSQRSARTTPRSRIPNQNLLFDLAETLVLSAVQEAARQCDFAAPRRDVLVHRILLRLTRAALGSHRDSPRADRQLTPELAQIIYAHMAPELDSAASSVGTPQLSFTSPSTASPVESVGSSKNKASDDSGGGGGRYKRSSPNVNAKAYGKRRKD